MKSIPKLIRRFVGIMMLSILLLVVMNVVFFAMAFVRNISTVSAWDVADQAAAELQWTDQGYSLTDEMCETLKAQNVWAILIDEDTQKVIWQTDNLPDHIPRQYTLSEIADLARGYVNGYPAFTGAAEKGLLVLGYPKDSYWKLTRANWDYDFIASLPKNVLIAFGVNMGLVFAIYVTANSGLLYSVKPIIGGIQNLADSIPVNVEEKGVLSELAESINRTSIILQEQAAELQKKETARANWIAGVSHDIRTPLSMVMGYAGQLESSGDLPEGERKRAAAIVRQSRRIKDLIDDLNLASRLEYHMQPLRISKKNAVAIVRQVVVDFVNLDIEDKFPLEWTTDAGLTVCEIEADEGLLKRAVANLIQNSINHNENGCHIFVSVNSDENDCVISVEDNGAGVSDEQIERLNYAPHYMCCDANDFGGQHGLGLRIVKQIIDAHNGTVTVGHSRWNGFRTVLTIPKVSV